jgi:hypothetical protein
LPVPSFVRVFQIITYTRYHHPAVEEKRGILGLMFSRITSSLSSPSREANDQILYVLEIRANSVYSVL